VRVRLVVNVLSRRGRVQGEAVHDELQQLGIAIAGDPADRQVDAIVVAGGDGTLVRQIPRALELRVPVGIVPLGTFNDLARTLAIPLGVRGACAIIAAGRTRTIDVARVNGTCYLSEASIGLSSRLARRQRPDDKQRFGFFAILASALQAMRYARPFHAGIRFDGGRARVRAIQLTVANSQRFGGFITAADAAIDDGRLECYSVQIDNLVDFVSVAAAIVAGRRQTTQGLRTFRSRAFDITTRRPHHITADGEPAGKTPARFEVLPGALRVFAP